MNLFDVESSKSYSFIHPITKNQVVGKVIFKHVERFMNRCSSDSVIIMKINHGNKLYNIEGFSAPDSKDFMENFKLVWFGEPRKDYVCGDVILNEKETIPDITLSESITMMEIFKEITKQWKTRNEKFNHTALVKLHTLIQNNIPTELPSQEGEIFNIDTLQFIKDASKHVEIGNIFSLPHSNIKIGDQIYLKTKYGILDVKVKDITDDNGYILTLDNGTDIVVSKGVKGRLHIDTHGLTERAIRCSFMTSNSELINHNFIDWEKLDDETMFKVYFKRVELFKDDLYLKSRFGYAKVEFVNKTIDDNDGTYTFNFICDKKEFSVIKKEGGKALISKEIFGTERDVAIMFTTPIDNGNKLAAKKDDNSGSKQTKILVNEKPIDQPEDYDKNCGEPDNSEIYNNLNMAVSTSDMPDDDAIDLDLIRHIIMKMHNPTFKAPDGKVYPISDMIFGVSRNGATIQFK